LVEAIETLAKEKNVTASQLALAWVLSKNIVPIPGTKRRKYLEQNIDASNILLNVEEINLLESIIPLGTDTGKSYDDWGMGLIDN
jgi:aryl-alcohol dehydrogenase-like predicted oxidoreductase